MRKIIFSDVDGCLIGQGPPCLTSIAQDIRIVSKSFLLILTTGKTAHEIIHLNNYLRLPGPFIIENGHGILFKGPVPLIPIFSKTISMGDYSLLPLGEKKPDPCLLKSISLSPTLLTDMTNDQLASLTGMSTEDTYFAKQRFFTEPIFIKDLSPIALKILKKQLVNKKLCYIQTSRFLHVTRRSWNKGRAIKFLLQSLFCEQANKTYAIGDSLNDFSMFAECEHNYYISNQPYERLPNYCELILEKELSGWLKIISKIT